MIRAHQIISGAIFLVFVFLVTSCKKDELEPELWVGMWKIDEVIVETYYTGDGLKQNITTYDAGTIFFNNNDTGHITIDYGERENVRFPSYYQTIDYPFKWGYSKSSPINMYLLREKGCEVCIYLSSIEIDTLNKKAVLFHSDHDNNNEHEEYWLDVTVNISKITP